MTANETKRNIGTDDDAYPSKGLTQPRSQGPFSTSKKYLEVERGPWERG